MKVHVVIGLYGGVLDEVKVFTSDEKATQFERELCEKYGIPFDPKEREEYQEYGEHEVHHWVDIEVIE